MRIVSESAELIWCTSNSEQIIEEAGRTCYQSAALITPESAIRFIQNIIKRGHTSVLEHASASFRLILDRAIANEAVRHRLASPSQSSTRYVSSATTEKLEGMELEAAIDLYCRGYSLKRLIALGNGTFSKRNVRFGAALKRQQLYARFEAEGQLKLGEPQEHFGSVVTAEAAYLQGLLSVAGKASPYVDTITLLRPTAMSWYVERLSETVRSGKRDYQICNLRDGSSHYEFIGLDRTGVRCSGYRDQETEPTGVQRVAALRASIPTKLIPDFLRGCLDAYGRVYLDVESDEPKSLGFIVDNDLVDLLKAWICQMVYFAGFMLSPAEIPGFTLIQVTDDTAVLELCKRMYANFAFPYGDPINTSAVFEAIPELKLKYAEWGESRFEVVPPLFEPQVSAALWEWAQAVDEDERHYSNLVKLGQTPQFARSVLPCSLKTELVLTANFREWMHIFDLRLDKAAHPQIRRLMYKPWSILRGIAPTIFNTERYFSRVEDFVPNVRELGAVPIAAQAGP